MDTAALAQLVPPSQRAKLGPAAQKLLQGLLSEDQGVYFVRDELCDIEGLTTHEFGTLWPLMSALGHDRRAALALSEAIKRKAFARGLEPLLDKDAALIHFGQLQHVGEVFFTLHYVEQPLPEELKPHLRRLLGEPTGEVMKHLAFKCLTLAKLIDEDSVALVTRAYAEHCGENPAWMREFEAIKTFRHDTRSRIHEWLNQQMYEHPGRVKPKLPQNEAYASAARELLNEVLAHLDDIHAGRIPYRADKAFELGETAIIERAARAASEWREPWFGAVIKRLLPLVCVAPTEAKTAPSQSIAIALSKVIEAEPTVESVQALREALRVVRHAGLKKKLQRHIKPAERALMQNSQGGDTLVPDLGLDESGTMQLDFGARVFSVAFDEMLTPYVRDAQGERIKGLPKPIKSDNQELALAASERYKTLKKDVKAVATFQIARMEAAMATGERWPEADFVENFVRQPLLRHLAARLAWAEYADGAIVRLFRVAEDWSLADCNDDVCHLSPGSEIGIAHALTAPALPWQAMARVFADYEILQPFRQFGRETYALAESEKTAQEVTRFKGKSVAIGSLMGLQNRGWACVEIEDSWIQGFEKRLPGGKMATMAIDPGYASYEKILDAQTLGKLTLSENRKTCSFDAIDTLTASELLREFDLMRPLDA
jgi:hypothetical protein